MRDQISANIRARGLPSGARRKYFHKYDVLSSLRVFISDISPFHIRQLNDPDLTFRVGGGREMAEIHAGGGGDGVKELNAIFPA